MCGKGGTLGAHSRGLLHEGDGGVEQQQRQDERKVCPVQQRDCDDGRGLHRPAWGSTQAAMPQHGMGLLFTNV